MAPLRKKVTAILEADKTGQYKTYKTDLEALAKETDPTKQFELPTGTYSNITVLVQSDIAYDGIALGIAGTGLVKVKFGIRFRAPGLDKTVHALELDAIAPIVWYHKIQGSDDNFVSQASFTGNFSGGTTLTVQVHTEAFAFSAPFVSFSKILASSGSIDFVRITGSN